MFVNNSVLFFIFFFYGVTQVHDQGHKFDILTCVDLSYFFFSISSYSVKLDEN